MVEARSRPEGKEPPEVLDHLQDVARLRPHKVLASEPWLAAACDGRGPRWPGGLDRRWARRRVQDGLGGRVRWVEVGSAAPDETARALAAAGITLAVRDGTSGESGFVN